MDYIFGTEYLDGIEVEVVKTRGTKPMRELEGFVSVERHYSDNIITDSFRVVKKLREREDAQGKVYIWYVIDHHYRDMDKFTPQIGATEQLITDTEISLIEHEQQLTELEIADMEQQQAITDNEIAIMELQEAIINK